MKVHIVIRLVMHILVLVGILGFFAIFPRSWQNILPPIVPIGLLFKTPGRSYLRMLADASFWTVFVGFWALWTLIIVSIAALVMDVRVLRRADRLQARLSRSVAMELLLPAGWFASIFVIRGVAGFGMIVDPPPLVEPIWLMLPGSAIMLSALASAVVAWLLVKDKVKAAVSVAQVWIARVIAVMLTLIAVAMASLFAFLGVLVALYPPTISSGGP